MTKKVICIIPARGGSKGLKLKNLQKINHKPLIYYTIPTTGRVVGSKVVATAIPDLGSIVKKSIQCRGCVEVPLPHLVVLCPEGL